MVSLADMSPENPINALLDAERSAEAGIERRRLAAKEVINQALEDARVISERAHRRIGKIHTHCATRIQAESERLWRAFEAEPESVIGARAAPERIPAVAARVAEILLSGGGDE